MMERFLRLLLFLFIISIVSLSFFVPEWADYFSWVSSMRSSNILEFMWNGYFDWDGRTLTIVGLIEAFSVCYLPHFLIIILYSVVFVSNALLISRLMNFSLDLINRLVLHIMVLASLFYGFYSHISETVFLAIGGFYSLHLFFGLIFVFLLAKIEAGVLSCNNILIFVLALVAGSGTQNFTPALIVYVAYQLIFDRDKSLRNRYLLALAGLIIGLLFISLAPGNFIRASATKSNFNMDVIWLMKLFVGITLRYLKYSIVLIAFAIFSALLMSGRIAPINGSFKKYLITNSVWLLMALATVAPMVLVPSETSLRTAIFFMAFLYVFVFKMSLWFFDHLKVFVFKKAIVGVLICMVMAHFYLMSIQYRDGARAQNARKAMETEILKQKQQGVDTVVVCQPALPITAFTINYNKYRITSNSDSWINQQQSRYYGLTAIVNSCSDVE